MKFANKKLNRQGYFLLAIILAASFPCYAETITVNGQLNEPEWSKAQVFTDFTVTQPLTLAKPQYTTEVRVLSLPEGLALAFINQQPISEIARNGPKRSRDASPMSSDIVYAHIDFDGTGNRAYEFLVSLGGAQRDGTLTNENQFSYDWDARWQSAVSQTDKDWTVEMLIPWSVAPMREADGDKRTMGVNFGRFVDALAVRYALPAISFSQPRYISQFKKIDVAAQRDSSFDFFPYVSMQNNLLDNTFDTKLGADIFWRPNSYFQLNAAINPDFGQIESDNLVVNFSAIETFFSDKRPFFTENQSLFEISTPQGGSILYTRRVGGPSDDGSGIAADIDAALKVSGSFAGFDYGLFGAQEADASGRSFTAVRVLRPSEILTFGQLLLHTERPALDRIADVQAFDWRWRVNSKFSLDGALVRSNIALGADEISDTGAWVSASYVPNIRWKFESTFTHYGDQLELNDFGFSFRNNLNQLFTYASFRNTQLDANSPLVAVNWDATYIERFNDSGDRLQGFGKLSRDAEVKGGGHHYLEVGYDPSGIDDLISRGNGNVVMKPRSSFWYYYQSPQVGRWKYFLGAYTYQEGHGGRAYQFESDISYQINERLSLSANFYPAHSNDWLIWQNGNQLASYSRDKVDASINLQWFPAAKHEFRLKAEWIAIDARNAKPWVISGTGELVEDARIENDFTIANFGLQARYRYEFSPQRELYIVYGRGGFERVESHNRNVGDLFIDAVSFREADQLLVKIRWRF